jgi:hypothetical protein
MSNLYKDNEKSQSYPTGTNHNSNPHTPSTKTPDLHRILDIATMSLSSSSSSSPSPDPEAYISILRNIKRKALNAGTKSQDFDNYLRRVLHTVRGPKYDKYTEEEKTWHIDLFMWEQYCKLLAAIPPLPSRQKLTNPPSFLVTNVPFPFLNDIDFHPSRPSSRPVFRTPSISRPIDVITRSTNCVPARHHPGPNNAVYLNQLRVWPPWQRTSGFGHVPYMDMGFPPLMGSLTGRWGNGVLNGRPPPVTPTHTCNGTQPASPHTRFHGR